MDYTEQINAAIRATASRFHDDGIKTAKDMIPAMDPAAVTGAVKRDVCYGTHPQEKMDLYYPDQKKEKYPVFAEVHGGAWYFGQKSSIEFEPFLLGQKKGYVLVSIEYPLAPEAHYPAPVIALKKAIQYLKTHCEELALDPDEITLWGGSAGAHLCALSVFSEGTGYLKQPGSIDATVKNLILAYGCHNYYLGTPLDSWVYENFFGTEDLSRIPETLVLSNPGAHVTKQVPRVLLQHGKKDGLVSFSQSVYLADVIRRIAGEDRVRLELFDDCDHADVKLFSKENIEHIFSWIQGEV